MWWGGQALAVMAKPQGLCRGTLTCEPWGHHSPASLPPPAHRSPGESLEETFPGSLRGAGDTPAPAFPSGSAEELLALICSMAAMKRKAPKSREDGESNYPRSSLKPEGRAGQGRGCRGEVKGGKQKLSPGAPVQSLPCAQQGRLVVWGGTTSPGLLGGAQWVCLSPHRSLPACLQSVCCASAWTLTPMVVGRPCQEDGLLPDELPGGCLQLSAGAQRGTQSL